MGRSKVASVMAIMACVVGLMGGAAFAEEPTTDQLKQQITQLQSRILLLEIELLDSEQNLKAKVQQLESAQADSQSTKDIDPAQVAQATAKPAQHPDAAVIETEAKVSQEPAAASIDKPAAEDQSTEDLTLPISQERADLTEPADEQADAVDAAADTEVITAGVEESDDAQTVEDESPAASLNETADAALNSQAIQPTAPATQPAPVATVDESAAVGQAEEDADAPSLVQIDQEPLDELP